MDITTNGHNGLGVNSVKSKNYIILTKKVFTLSYFGFFHWTIDFVVGIMFVYMLKYLKSFEI